MTAKQHPYRKFLKSAETVEFYLRKRHFTIRSDIMPTSAGNSDEYVRLATLRGVSPDQVLVLINGKLRHQSALVNLNGSVGRGQLQSI